jgi:hypothetical protein
MALGVSPDGTGKCAAGSQPLIDDLAIGITHLLLVIAIIRLLSRTDLDREPQRKAEGDRLPPRRRCRARRLVQRASATASG